MDTDELNFRPQMPTCEGCYWMKCDENGQAQEWVSVYWAISNRGKQKYLACDWSLGSRFSLSSVHGGLTNVTWAAAIIVT